MNDGKNTVNWRSSRKKERKKHFSSETSVLKWIVFELLFEWINCWVIDCYLSLLVSFKLVSSIKYGTEPLQKVSLSLIWKGDEEKPNRKEPKFETESHCVASGFCVKFWFSDWDTLYEFLWMAFWIGLTWTNNWIKLESWLNQLQVRLRFIFQITSWDF